MTNNDYLKNIRYTFDFSDTKMMAIFALADLQVDRWLLARWFKKDDDPDYKDCEDVEFAIFLNGLIIDKRGKKDGPKPVPEKEITNNIILRKLKIALDLKSEDLLEILALADFKLSNHELTAFFRKPNHKNFRICKDQVLRNFLKGLQIKFRPSIKK